MIDPTEYPKTVGIYRLPLAYLRAQFKFSEVMQTRISELESLGYAFWRKARGDGNCYYRSVGVLYLEGLIRTQLLPSAKIISDLQELAQLLNIQPVSA